MNAVVDALTTTLLHSTWQIAAVAVLLWGALQLTRAASAKVRYSLGCAALAAVVLLPLATFVGTFSRVDETTFRAVVVPEQSRTVWLVHQNHSSNRAGQAATAQAALMASVETWIVPLWLAGVACCSLRLVVSAQYVRTMRRTSIPAPPLVVETVRRLASAMKVTRRIDVMVTAMGGSPGALGCLKPMILLPAVALSGLTPSQLEAILAHEIAHIRRHDYLVNLLQMTAETALFYHPAVWWISRRIRFERELCCDEAAVQANGDVVNYAQALAAVARQSVAHSLVVSAATLSLPERVRRLLAPQRQTPTATTVSVAAAALLALGLVAGSATWVNSQNSTRGRVDGLATLTLTVIDPLGHPARGIPLVYEQGAFQDGAVFGDGTTDSNGRYTVRLPAGSYLFSALIDFFPGTEVALRPGDRVKREVRMKLEPVTGAFTVCIDCASAVAPAEASVAADLQRDRADYARALTRTAEPLGGWEHYQLAVPASLRSLNTAVQGSVTVAGRVQQGGRLAGVRIVSAAHPALASAALTALESQRWEPARVGSTAVEVDFVLDLHFIRAAATQVPVASPSQQVVGSPLQPRRDIVATQAAPENPIPRRISSVPVVHPEEWKALGYSAAIELLVVLDASGSVASVTAGAASTSDPLNPAAASDRPASASETALARLRQERGVMQAFGDAAAAAISRWRYAPPATAPLQFYVGVTFKPGEPPTVSQSPDARGVSAAGTDAWIGNLSERPS